MRQIPLTKGKAAIVDDADYEWLSAWKWQATKAKHGTFYASRAERHGGRGRTILMHREIGQAVRGQHVDHWSGDGLDNRRSNLRPCTPSQNVGNTNGRSKSGFKGVTWHKRQKRWMAQIGMNYRVRFLGYFDDPADAARAYDAAARGHFGQFARLNFPTESETKNGTARKAS